MRDTSPVAVVERRWCLWEHCAEMSWVGPQGVWDGPVPSSCPRDPWHEPGTDSGSDHRFSRGFCRCCLLNCLFTTMWQHWIFLTDALPRTCFGFMDIVVGPRHPKDCCGQAAGTGGNVAWSHWRLNGAEGWGGHAAHGRSSPCSSWLVMLNGLSSAQSC